MLLQRRFSKKLFWTNFCLVVPILSVSIIMFSLIVMEMKRLGQEELQRQADDAMMKLETYYSIYSEESILMSERWELLPYRIDATPQQTGKGIELLRMKRYFDSRIRDVFLYKGTEYVYSSMGLSSKRVHFAADLSCREESVLYGLEAIEKEENALTLLFRVDAVGKGYLMYSYVTRRTEDAHVSINFVMPLEQVAEIFQPLEGNRWYQLEDQNGSVVAMGCDDSGNMKVFSEEEWEERIHDGQYGVIEERLENFGFTVKLCYRKNFGDLSGGLFRMQVVNMALIIAGILLSAVISWSLSRRRMEEIGYLEDIAGGDLGYRFPTDSIYRPLENIIVNGLQDTRQLEKRVLERDAQLMEKTAYMIFHGMVSYSELQVVFEKLGLKGMPDCFFVCAVSAAEPMGAGIPSLLENCLQAYVVHDDLQAKAFLCELQAEDGNRIHRKGIAGEIRKCMHQQGFSRVRIGMSRVYENPMMTDCAYREAVRSLEYVISGKGKDFCGCWEDMMQETGFVMPDVSMLQKFSEALAERDFKEAIRLFWHMMDASALRECSEENRQYIRYTILDRLVEYLNMSGAGERKVHLKECLNVAVGDEKKYTQMIMTVLKYQAMKKDDDKFTRMLRYIEENYKRSDLTFEEVAEAGGIGKTYVSKVFRSRLGMSYIEYLTMVRMECAAGLLRATDISIQEIAKTVGYESVSSFRRCFKDRFGMNAADYRKKEQEIDEAD